jgi:UDP-N-acetylglucosamine diphosphorylase/glucosamine-1-phosphate N-acetyltransferase
MTNLILFDDPAVVEQLQPFSFTRPIGDLRIGILTIKEKWEKRIGITASFQCRSTLQNKFPLKIERQNLLINASVLADDTLLDRINNLPMNHALVKGAVLLAMRVNEEQAIAFFEGNTLPEMDTLEWDADIGQVAHLWDIFSLNDQEIRKDFELLTKGRNSQQLSDSNQLIGDLQQLFIEEGASVECAVLNTKTGPIYIGKDAQVMEGSLLRGPIAICEHAVTKLGTKIYGATTIGPYSKVGGEINNSVLFAYSNKGHDGFLGNSVLGEWCNLGADTNNSNLKNNYSDIKIWDYSTKDYVNSKLQFCGLFMGDHSKSGINTMFNTGTVVGVSANVFGAGFPDKFIPSFSWGGVEGLSTYRFEEATETAKRMMERRAIEFTETDEKILWEVFIRESEFRADNTAL